MTAKMNADRLTISSGAASDLFKLQSDGDNQRNSNANNDSHQRLNTSESSFNSSFNSCESDGIDQSPSHPRMTVLTRANTTSGTGGLSSTTRKMAPNRAKSAPIQPVRRKCSIDNNDIKRVNYYDSPNKLPQSPATPTSTTSSPSHLTSYLARLATAKQQFNQQQQQQQQQQHGGKSSKTGSSSNDDGILISPLKERGGRKKDSTKQKRSNSKHRRGSIQRAKSAPASSPILSRKKNLDTNSPATRRRYSSPLADFMNGLLSDAESRHGIPKFKVSLEQDNATIPKADTDSATTTPITSNTSSPEKGHSSSQSDSKKRMVHVLDEVRHVSKARQEADNGKIATANPSSTAVAFTSSSDRKQKMVDVLDEVRHVSKARQEIPFYHCRWSPYIMIGEEAIMTTRDGSKNNSDIEQTKLRQRNEVLAEVRRRNSNTSAASSVTIKTQNTTRGATSGGAQPKDATRQRQKSRWSSSP